MEEKMPKDFNKVLHDITEIKKCKEHNWMSAILEYCEVNNYRIEEVGYILKENKNFLKIISSDFKLNNHIKMEKELNKNINEWI